MHPFSDSDTSDSEDGIRFKTQSTRKKEKSVKEQRKLSPEHRKESRRRRSRSRSRHRHRSRSRDRHRHKKHRRGRGIHERQSSSRSTDSARPVKSSKEVPESNNDRVKHVSSDVSRRKDGGSSEDRSLQSKESIGKRGEEDVKVTDATFGPSLPPNFARNELRDTDGNKILPSRSTALNPAKLNNDASDNRETLQVKSSIDVNTSSFEAVDIIGPALPGSLNYDSAIEHVGDNKADGVGSVCTESNVEMDNIGPLLSTKCVTRDSPPQSESSNSSINNVNIGPSLPPKYGVNSESTLSSNESSDECIGPALPLNPLDNDSHIGPILPSSIVQNDSFLGITLPSNLLRSDTSIGAALPTLLFKDGSFKDENEMSIGPSLPIDLVQDNSIVGPSLPCKDNTILGQILPSLLRNTNDVEMQNANFGPSLPPSFSKTKEPKCIGPTLPAHLREKLKNNEEISEFAEEADDDDYGPLPADANPRTNAHVALEERALQMKLDKLNPTEDGKPRREEWMMELPSAAAKIGLGPRQFRAKERLDMSDRSSWTDTPQDKEKKKEKPVDLKEEAELQEAKRRDKEQEAIIKNHKKKKKRDKSLLEQHQEKIKKKKEEESTSSNVRRPFSRDIDLKVNHFDEAQKKAIFKKAQLLDDRFSKGQTKYL